MIFTRSTSFYISAYTLSKVYHVFQFFYFQFSLSHMTNIFRLILFTIADVLMPSLEPKAKKASYTTRNSNKPTGEGNLDKEMSNCFGFDVGA